MLLTVIYWTYLQAAWTFGKLFDNSEMAEAQRDVCSQEHWDWHASHVVCRPWSRSFICAFGQ